MGTFGAGAGAGLSALSFRVLGADDVDALQDLLESVPSYSERITGYPPGPSDGLSALISVPDGFDPADKYGFGLWDGDVLVAFADVLVGYPAPGFAFVGLLVVRGDRHGQGIGRALHEAVVGELRGSRAAGAGGAAGAGAAGAGAGGAGGAAGAGAAGAAAGAAGSAGVERLRLGIVATNAAVAEPFWRDLGYASTGETKPYRYDHLVSTVALWERAL